MLLPTGRQRKKLPTASTAAAAVTSEIEGMIVPTPVTRNVPVMFSCRAVLVPAVQIEAADPTALLVDPVWVAAVPVAPSIPMA